MTPQPGRPACCSICLGPEQGSKSAVRPSNLGEEQDSHDDNPDLV